MALIRGGTDGGRAGEARASHADVGHRAGVAVGAAGVVRLGRVGAGAGSGVADARIVTLVHCGADDGSTAAHTQRADVAERAGVAVITRPAFVGGRVRASAGRVAAVVRAGVEVIADLLSPHTLVERLLIGGDGRRGVGAVAQTPE